MNGIDGRADGQMDGWMDLGIKKIVVLNLIDSLVFFIGGSVRFVMIISMLLCGFSRVG